MFPLAFPSLHQRPRPKPFHFETRCVEAIGEDITAMVDRARQISRQTFRRHVDLTRFAKGLGYDRHFPITRDYHVRYFRSVYQGRRCYYLVWSAIEHVFTERTR